MSVPQNHDDEKEKDDQARVAEQCASDDRRTASAVSDGSARTPGPWSVHRIEYPRGMDVSFEIKAGRTLVAQTIMREAATESGLIAIDAANAHLMAIAPDLLAALSDARGYLLNVKIDIETGHKKSAATTIEIGLTCVRAAIAKAEGRS